MAWRTPQSWKRVFGGLLAAASIALALTTATADRTRERPVMDPPFLPGSDIPPRVRAVLQRACQNCHSKNTEWPWYSNMPLISEQIHSDVANARAFLDLSNWNEYTESKRRGFAAAIGAAVQSHFMPPPRYILLHHEASLSSDELTLVTAWAFGKHAEARTQ